MKTASTTTAARRIARVHNSRFKAGFAGNGFLVFDQDGNGGAWYSDNSRPPLGPGEFKVPMRWGKLAAAVAQEILDACADE